jgi:hypothetical protein
MPLALQKLGNKMIELVALFLMTVKYFSPFGNTRNLEKKKKLIRTLPKY